MSESEFDETTARARLPNLDIDIVHRRARSGDMEALSITLQATPSFKAFGHGLDGASPLQFWASVAEAMWMPWLKLLDAAYSLPAPAARPMRRDPTKQVTAGASTAS
jgi:hypothetical protein